MRRFRTSWVLILLAMVAVAYAQAPTPTPNWISIKASPFSARGNGSTDDTAAIQAAIDYAFAHGLGTVYCPPGNYKTTGTIYLLPPGDPNRPNGSGAVISGAKIAFFSDPVGPAAANPACKLSPNFTAVTYVIPWNFGTVTGTREAVTLTSNNYTVTATDCGKLKTLPTGTSPTVTLPNLNQECTIVFETTVAISYQFVAASGGSTQNSQGFSHTGGTNPGDTVIVNIVTPSATAAKWNVSGDVTS